MIWGQRVIFFKKNKKIDTQNNIILDLMVEGSPGLSVPFPVLMEEVKKKRKEEQEGRRNPFYLPKT